MAKIKIPQNRDLARIISGVTLIVLVFVLNGFLSFITVGFNFDNLKTGTYWASFSILISSELAVMFGVYIIQKCKDLQNKKITDLQKSIADQREIVYTADKVAEAEDWLHDIFNYKEKLTIFENSLKNAYERLKAREPKENEKFYKVKKRRYDRQQEKKEYLIEQMQFVKKDKQRLKALISKDFETAETLNKEIDVDSYEFKTAKIHYRDVYWGNLMSDIEEVRRKETSAFFSEKKELSKNFVRYFGMGLIVSAFISALTFPAFSSMGWQAILSCVMSLIALITFMLRGVGLSNKIILGTYYKSLEKRKSIYVKMLKDLDLSKVELVEEEE